MKERFEYSNNSTVFIHPGIACGNCNNWDCVVHPDFKYKLIKGANHFCKITEEERNDKDRK